MNTQIDALINVCSGTVRLWRGAMAFRHRSQPLQKPLKLYDIEACPYCRLVRETLTELDLDVVILPCPKNGTRFRNEAKQIGGKAQFPFLIDDNTGTQLYESADIIDYLHRNYGPAFRTPGWLYPFDLLTSQLSSMLMLRPTGMSGLRARPSRAPSQMLTLYSFETSPYSKPVRAKLCELELPYVLHNTGKGHWRDIGPPSFRDRLFKGALGTTRNRRWLAEHTGRVQVPYLIDANTNTAMYESQAIIEYLDRTYALR